PWLKTRRMSPGRGPNAMRFKAWRAVEAPPLTGSSTLIEKSFCVHDPLPHVGPSPEHLPAPATFPAGLLPPEAAEACTRSCLQKVTAGTRTTRQARDLSRSRPRVKTGRH